MVFLIFKTIYLTYLIHFYEHLALHFEILLCRGTDEVFELPRDLSSALGQSFGLQGIKS